MIFPFGINKEAEIYCNASKTPFVLNQMEEYESTNSIGINVNYGWSFNSEDYPTIIRWVESAVRKSGWSLTDEDGVTWWIGLFLRAYLRVAADQHCHIQYDRIFKDLFIKYFEYR